MMRLTLRMMTLIYIVAIFVLADSPMAKELSRFNPYSLLHIPLYGMLSLLLLFSFPPTSKLPLTHPGISLLPIQISEKKAFFRSGIIALAIGMADEIYQSYLPSRDASVMDLFLDFSGIVLTLFCLYYFLKTRNRKTQKV